MAGSIRVNNLVKYSKECNLNNLHEFPFKEYNILDNIYIRKFSLDLQGDELIWHKDHEDRVIRVLYGHDWSVQIENHLPIQLQEGDWFYIPKMEWHRIIKGKSDLIIQLIKI